MLCGPAVSPIQSLNGSCAHVLIISRHVMSGHVKPFHMIACCTACRNHGMACRIISPLTSSTRTRRGGSCLKDIYIYIRPFSSIELACAVRQPSPCVCALCESGVLFHMSHLKLHFGLHPSHSTLQTPHSTLHTSHCTLPTANSTLHTSQSTLHTSQSTLHTSQSTLHTPHFTLHSPHFTLHTPHVTLHSSRPTLHTAPFTLHTSSHLTHLSSFHLVPAHLFSSHLFSYVI